MTKAQIKFLVLVALVLGLWRVFEMPAVNEAVWNFLTLGLVPGTDMMLSAETVIRGSLALFVFALFLIFRKEFMASIPSTWFRRNKKAPAILAPASPIVAVLPRRPSLKGDRTPLIRATGYGVGWLVYLVSAISAAIEKALRFIAFYVARAAQRAWRAATIITLRMWALSVKVWYFVEPFLREFDHWLNVMVHKSKIASEMLDILEACLKELRARWQRADVRARDVFEDR